MSTFQGLGAGYRATPIRHRPCPRPRGLLGRANGRLSSAAAPFVGPVTSFAQQPPGRHDCPRYRRLCGIPGNHI